jgi:tRNA (guanine37-N1)-methyltransferase
VKTYNPRDFCQDKYRKVDDTPYGGGAGMLMKPEPIFAAVESIERKPGSPVIFLSAHGRQFTQQIARDLSLETDIVILCGHYEGIDERIKTLITQEISLGDFVLTGGELPALAVIDAVGRLIPGVLGKASSLADESFVHGLLEAPQYTKPPVFAGMEVPEVLRSGDHKAIERWRRNQALRITFEKRPELLHEALLDQEDLKFLKTLRSQI